MKFSWSVLAGIFIWNLKKQLPVVFYKKAVLKNFVMSRGRNHLCWSLFLIKLQAFRTAAQVLSWEYCEVFKNSCFEHARALLLNLCFCDYSFKNDKQVNNSHKNTFFRPVTVFKRHWQRCFPVSFEKCFKATFLQNTCELLLHHPLH